MPVSRNARIVVADDDSSVREALSQALAAEGHEIIEANNAESALESIRRESPDLAFLDLRMPGMATLDVLPRIREADPELSVVIITGYGSVENAVSAMRAGAYDFIEKPIRRDVLLALVARAVEHRSLRREVSRRRAEDAGSGIDAILGESGEIVNLRNQIERIAASPSTTTLILGESGCGKELVARAVHASSARAREPWVAVNCAALSGGLMESELFGYERGAFSGADPLGREGLFEQSNGGTLFLDEVSELDLSLQSKLLRALEDRAIRRVGGNRVRKLDIRIIAASNRNLPAEVAAGRFRADLYYRCAVVTITVPPLRERRGDIVALAKHFLRICGEALGKRYLQFEDETLRALESYHWPGNVRELRNAVERACITARGRSILPADLGIVRIRTAGPVAVRPLAAVEAELIDAAMRQMGGNISLAARALGLHRSTLHRKLEQRQRGAAASISLESEV
ncbi:MAG: sigma-54-dependent Fis family transcriptional regulator [Planctomycetes bacterium]|nr:sigma-54-dependent Fis family transcriptional regulator [Planctomycetota bacterium]